MVRVVLKSLFTSDEVFQYSQLVQSRQVRRICGEIRPQAMRFLTEYIGKQVPVKQAQVPYEDIVTLDTLVLRQSDFALIFDFYFKLAD